MTSPDPSPALTKRETDGGLSPDLWKISTVVFFGPFLSILSATVVNISIAAMAAEFQVGLSTIQWVITGYLLALALMLPLTGWVVDRFGAKRIYVCSFAAFTITSTLCGFALSAEMLIALRVLQGMAGGLLAPMAQMMVARHAGSQMSRVFGYIAFPVTLAPVFGPIVGGLILDYASWRWIFFLNIPFGVLAIALAIMLLPKDDDLNLRPLDLAGFAMISPGIVLILDGIQAVASGAMAWWRWLELLLGGLLIALFTVHSLRLGDRAVFDLRLFGRRTFAVASIIQFLANAASFGGQFLLPLYLLTVREIAPSEAGLLLMPMGIGMAIAMPLMGRMVQMFGSRLVTGAGASFCLIGTLPFVFTGIHWPQLFLGAALLVRGIGLGSIGVPTVSLAYKAIPRSQLANATTAINIVQRLGGPIGTTALALILHRYASPSASGLGDLDFGADMMIGFSFAAGLLCFFHALCLLSTLALPQARD